MKILRSDLKKARQHKFYAILSLLEWHAWNDSNGLWADDLNVTMNGPDESEGKDWTCLGPELAEKTLQMLDTDEEYWIVEDSNH